METNSLRSHSGFFAQLVKHPAIRDDVVEFVTLILREALLVSEIRGHLAMTLSGKEIVEILKTTLSSQIEAPFNENHEVMGRQQITARDAAKILRYNSHYFSRKAKDWGLTKIRMSRTSCRYYLDEVEQLAVDRGIRRTI